MTTYLEMLNRAALARFHCSCCILLCRCQREWRRAFELASSGSVGDERGACQVVVAAVGKCSRPEKLKNFLYLDFIDRDKRDYVLKKLVDTISMYLTTHP